MIEESAADYYEMSLTQIREHKGYSRRELSRMTGISEESLYLIERKGQLPRADTIAILCSALGISAKTLLHSLGVDVSGLPDDE